MEVQVISNFPNTGLEISIPYGSELSRLHLPLELSIELLASQFCTGESYP
jgi:hypothetical protein